MVVIGVTDEDPALVDKFVQKFKPTYPIVILKSNDFEGFLGVEYFPYGAVIAPDGTLSFSGRAYDMGGAVGKAMSKAKK
ncbi:MAG: hypothetical protein O7B99_04120, partial [Planctomycetota bacterium]|nr:hypothetical protein [Planctomycetota bacterium]